MRFIEDPHYGHIMARLRLGTTTQDDLNVLNSRLLSYQTILPTDRYLRYLVISHTLRESVNTMSLLKHANFLNTPVYSFDAEIGRSKRCAPFTPEEKVALLKLRDHTTGFLPTRPVLFVGMRIMVTTNINSSKGLSNGSLGTITSITLDSNSCNTPRVFSDDTVLQSHTCLPTSVTIKLDGNEESLSPKDAKGEYTMTPTLYESRQIKLLNRSLSMNIRTFPLIPAYAMTVEKIQGETVDGIVLTTLHHSSRKSVPASLLYVALSRVRRLDQLYLTEELKMEDIKRPSDEILNEIERLRSLPS